MKHGPHIAFLAALTALALAAPMAAPSAWAKKPKQTQATREDAGKIRVARAKDDAAPVPSSSVTSPASPPARAVKALSRSEILASSRERLERIGRHIIIGYHSFSEVKALVEARAIAGIFITDHNVRGRTVSAIKAEIDALQAIRKDHGLPPLIVAADQEGGSVSRLSPPLKYQRALGTLIAKAPHDEERKSIVEAFAREQAAGLQRMGVTMNFGPVVDLRLNPSNYADGETRLRLRAISADPYTVAKVAGWYCDVLAEAGIMCTLKHFPGLGRVKRDTHVASAEISVSEGTLELNDWVPFRRVMAKPNAVTMLGHVRIGAVDRSTPSSYSQTVIGSLIRQQWDYGGLLITDDFSMGAITRSKPGVGGAAVRALNAGVDFILLSYSEKHLDGLMSELIAADEAGEIDAAMREESRNRIERSLPPLASAQAP